MDKDTWAQLVYDLITRRTACTGILFYLLHSFINLKVQSNNGKPKLVPANTAVEDGHLTKCVTLATVAAKPRGGGCTEWGEAG